MAITKVTRTLLSTGIVDNSNATAITIDSSENVGIGTGSPSYKLHVNGVSRFDNHIEFGGSISTPSTAAAIYRPADNTLAFSTANSERMRIESDGDVKISGTFGTNSSTAFGSMGGRLTFDTDYSNTQRGPNKIVLQEDSSWIAGFGVSDGSTDFYSGGNITFLTGTSNGTEKVRIQAAGGISFNGDTAAANALDDYEEGTWTPVVKLGTTTVTSTNTGFYTKIGRIITLQVQCGFSNLNSGSGNLTIEGIPFTSADVAHRNHGSVGYYNVADSFGANGVQARISRNSTFIDFMRSHEISPAQNGHVQSNTELYITITYKNE